MPLRTPTPRVLLLLAVASGACLGPALDARASSMRVVADFQGSEALGQLGAAVASIGDWNGDGIQDFAIGEPGWGPVTGDSTGRVLIFFGGRRTFVTPDITLIGEKSGSQFGAAIGCIGDVNQDGFDDLIVTAPNYLYATPTQGSGRAYLYRGAPIPSTTPWARLDAPVVYSGSPCRGFGGNVIGVGDANGDGYPDWAIGFDHSSTSPGGGALIYLGGTTPPTRYRSICLNPGASRPVLLGPGDIDGDHLPDLVIGSPFTHQISSTISIFSQVALSLAPTEWAFAGRAGSGFGTAMASLGDFNGDGLADFLITKPQTRSASEVCIYLGNTARSGVITGVPFQDMAIDSFGAGIAAGHLEGDSSIDVAVGACGDDSTGLNSGAVYVYRLGRDLSSTPIARLHGSVADYLGQQIAIPGDVDGDGVADLMLGVPLHNGAAPNSGRATILSLSAHTLIEPGGTGDWPAGGSLAVRWLGSAPARIELSLDDGASWRTMLDHAGGAADNLASVSLPDTICSAARVRVSVPGAPIGPLTGDVCTYSHSITRSAAQFSIASSTRSLSRADDPVGRLGLAIAVGDLDGDRRPEVIFGAPYSDLPEPNAGAVLVRPGNGAPPIRINGEAGADRFGAAVSAADDVDGDWNADLLVGAPGSASGGDDAGAAYLFTHGARGAPAWRRTGSEPGAEFGSAVLLARDILGDGRTSVVVSAPFHVPPSAPAGGGCVQIWPQLELTHATPPITLAAPPGTVEFGRVLATLDWNGDGHNDLVVASLGVAGAPGAVFIHFGGQGAHSKPDVILRGVYESDEFGAAIADAGDLNGDGVHDLAVGSPGANGGIGRVQIYFGGAHPGPIAAQTIDGLFPGERFGAAVAGAGDMNGDGRDDLVAGAPGREGTCRLFLGGGALPLAASWVDDAPGGMLGSVLAAGVGDDGTREIFAAAPFHDAGSSREAGEVLALQAPRYQIDSPGSAAAWFSGTTESVRWRGAEPARLELSVDGGRTWTTVGAALGGSDDNAADVVVPDAETDSASVRLTPVRAGAGPAVTAPFAFHIRRGGTLAWFRYSLSGDDVHLSWSAAPGIGPTGWTRYRVYRAGSGGALELVSPATLTDSTLVVSEHTRGITFELRAVNGFGEEQTLGRVTIPAPASALRIWPVPSDEWHAVQLAVDPPVLATGRTSEDFSVWIHDLNGRRLRCLAAGSLGTQMGEVQLVWDRKLIGGGTAPPGVYFVRAEVPSSGWREQRRMVILK